VRPALRVAVQKLNHRHRDDIARHLLGLPAEDRFLRFGHPVKDEAILEYVGRIDFERDRVFGVHASDLALAGVGHLAFDPAERSAELGLSVDAGSRGKGYGYALLRRGVVHAANLGYRALFMHCLADNRVMLHLARKAGLSVVVSAGEADGRLALDRRIHADFVEETMTDQFALIDCLLKQQDLWLAHAGLKSLPADQAESTDERRGTAGAAKALEGQVP
jgi:RimJ/RimL family protein N-acetyltransferase